MVGSRMKAALRFMKRQVGATIGRGLACLPGNLPPGTRIFSEPDAQVFFGYYDISPFSLDGTKILAQRAPAENISPHGPHPQLETGFYDLSRETAPRFQAFGRTATWNWQQGCRLQWFADGAGRRALYNRPGADGTYGAVICDIESGKTAREIPFPVYALSPDGKSALSLNFSRLHRMRPGYGYSNLPDRTRDVAIPEDDGVFLGDTETGKTNMVLSLAQAAALEPRETMKGARHYFNHLSFSPSGARWMVTHLWVGPDGKKASRILVSGKKGGFSCLNNDGFTSHYCWKDDESVIVFGRQGRAEAVGYFCHDLEAGQRQAIGPGLLTEDGHQTWLRDGRMLTDTYPDRLRFQKILLFCPRTGTLLSPARFYMPPGFSGEMRCDLHPRVNHAQDRVCVDAVFHGRRALCVFPL